ncbi:hypothetical protein H310_02186 [Aphanomyces invadans]|uniref:Uncharacterized protein n=1 Tax=Aphanomyces invadans TaxID=157072 RepID=A0A024UN60_9STRA|nr:hypothetical protein H310_02186 [Aphanomyces invadans]ETW07744.1 hypothetical protein H310_02186 [Aphanomyces invadans]|eukprot:XP_008863837.1 hypothetical protein H310_02186 [Aphanomyces invadans]
MTGSARVALSIAVIALVVTTSCDARHPNLLKASNALPRPWPFPIGTTITTIAPPTLNPPNGETTAQPTLEPTVVPTPAPQPTTSVPTTTLPTPPPVTPTPPTTETPTTIAPTTAAPVTTTLVPTPSPTADPTTTLAPTTWPPTAEPTTTVQPTPTPAETEAPSTPTVSTITPEPTTPETPPPSLDDQPLPPADPIPPTRPTIAVTTSVPPADDQNKAKNETSGNAKDETGMSNMQLLAIGGGALCAMVLVMIFVVARQRRKDADSKEDDLNQWTDSAFHTSRHNPLLNQRAPSTISQHPRALDTLEMLHTLNTEKRGKSVRFMSESNHHYRLNSMDSNILGDHEEGNEERLSESPRFSSSWSIGTTDLSTSREEDEASFASGGLWTATDQPLEDIEEASVDDDMSSAGSSTAVSLTFSPSSRGTSESWGTNSNPSFVSMEHPSHEFVSTSSSLESNDMIESSRYLDMIHTNVHVAADV